MLIMSILSFLYSVLCPIRAFNIFAPVLNVTPVDSFKFGESNIYCLVMG